MTTPIIPIPRRPVTVRLATPTDLPFIDGLQKLHTKMVGWMPAKQLEGKVSAGHVLVAESARRPVGYVISRDQYFKRDDVGIVYQMNVAPGSRRSLVGATLLKAVFERAAYGCRLFCCWCAQDIEANRFWESMGFVPLAFRAGSREKGRVHIFWQRRIRAGDATTPYWFPAQTSSGSIREDRLVLPIPPGTHWSGEMPRVLPQGEPAKDEAAAEEPKGLPGARAKREKLAQPKPSIYCISLSKLHFAAPAPAKVTNEKPPREKRKAVKNDPKLVAAARELRDRWLERANGEGLLFESCGKYDVSRALESATIPMPGVLAGNQPAVPALPAPAAA